jgi:DNA polymerase I-like protein with 3'-5' exonuclease and polymerase domains
MEIRMLAHLCADVDLVNLFCDETSADIYKSLAMKMFKKPLDMITEIDRNVAKTVRYFQVRVASL